MNRRSLFQSFGAVVCASALQCFGWCDEVKPITVSLHQKFLASGRIAYRLLENGITHHHEDGFSTPKAAFEAAGLPCPKEWLPIESQPHENFTWTTI